MSKRDAFIKQMETGYVCKGEYITLGCGMQEGEPLAEAQIKIPLKTLNRHGLIAGATGTGKTKTLQILAEQMSLQGIPVLMMDVKGDLSGVAAAGEEKSFITERHSKMQIPYSTAAFPVELLTLSKQPGVRLRATVSEFGPLLFSRILDLNDTQSGLVSMLFKYCDDHHLPLLDLKDIKKMIQFITEEGKAEIEREYGRISTATTGSVLRKIVELEQQGADLFFGELSFEINDLMRIDVQGRGYLNILRLTDIQDRPKLFSTFMLCLLAEIYQQMPEQGDSGRPELVIFIDEAHLVFNQASKALLEQIENIVKLIRSKGIGIYFVTQNPTDVPSGVLSQLGLKIQHALRAFTAVDRKAIKLTAQNYPDSEFYKTEEIITQLGIGEALVTALSEKGVPTPLAATMLRAPMSRMDILSEQEIASINARSKLVAKYQQTIDRESAYEIINRKLDAIEKQLENQQTTYKSAKPVGRSATPAGSSTTKSSSPPKRRSTAQNPVVKVLTSASFIRGVMGILNKALK